MKPEIWADEKVGLLTRDARLCLVGLLTMADDEGRLRAQPSMLLGHIFPWDEVAPKELSKWLDEIADAGLVVRYQHEGRPYIAFRHWKRHQVINKARQSELPPPPDPVVAKENSVSNSGSATGVTTVEGQDPVTPPTVALPERSRSESCSPARAVGKGRERNGSPPKPPEGGRRRDRVQWETDIDSWAAEHFPHLPADKRDYAVRQAVTRGADSFEAVQAHIDRWFPKLAALEAA